MTAILRRTFVALILLTICAAVGGCNSGGSDRLTKSEYLQRMRAIEAGPAARNASRLFLRLVVDPGLPRSACAAKARRFHRSLNEIVTAVASLKPPIDVQALQNRFVSAAQESVDEVGRAAEDAEAGTLRCGTPMNERIYGLPSTQRAEKVLSEYAKQGYIIGLNSSD